MDLAVLSTEIILFNHIIPKQVNLKMWLLIMNCYYIVPNLSIVLFKNYLSCSLKNLFKKFRQSSFNLSKQIIKHGQPCLHM